MSKYSIQHRGKIPKMVLHIAIGNDFTIMKFIESSIDCMYSLGLFDQSFLPKNLITYKTFLTFLQFYPYFW